MFISFITTLAQSSNYYSSDYGSDTSAASAGGLVFGALFWIIYLAVIVVTSISMWKLFTKAGQPGWAAIVPFYNMYVLLLIVKKPTWWIVLFFLPFVSFVAAILVSIELAKVFGKGTGFGVLLALVPIVGYPLLAFDKNTHYLGGSQSGNGSFAPSSAAPQQTATYAPNNNGPTPAGPTSSAPAAPNNDPNQT